MDSSEKVVPTNVRTIAMVVTLSLVSVISGVFQDGMENGVEIVCSILKYLHDFKRVSM